MALARVAPQFRGCASPGVGPAQGSGRRLTIRFAGRRTMFRPAYSGLWALPTRGGHTPSDLLHGRSYQVGDHTRPRRRTLGPASSRFRSGCSLTLSHTPVWPAAPRTAQAAVRRCDACALQSGCGKEGSDPVVHGPRYVHVVEGRRLHDGTSGAAPRRPLGPKALISQGQPGSAS